MFQRAAFSVLAIALVADAHMAIQEPKPFRAPDNPYATTKDYDLINPLAADGSNYPCRGHQVDFGTAAGTPTATFAAGEASSLTLRGSASHNGGSCQISLSFDGGSTFRVIKSYIGNCVRVIGGCTTISPIFAILPHLFSPATDPNQTYDFTIPSNAKTGDAILSWTWNNEIGNREMYNTCAPITITGSGSSTLDDYPSPLVAQIGSPVTCTIPEGTDVDYPNPGLDVTRDAATGKQGPPQGTCS
ncbi:lytic polysaccharide monooxygenase [Atractiella rhizophila]|nr:lytic polysaccharide monooxygenase [Atractiella rhizophila]